MVSRFVNNGKNCIFCNSKDLIKKIQIFKNDSEHFYCKCRRCRKQFYAPDEFITSDFPKEESKQRKKMIQHLIDLFL
jgi:transposase-like protein